ncbi:HAD domain-containing protein [Streptomyces xanthophaeus]
MTGARQQPLLFLDVDGPLIPFGAGPYAQGSGPNPLLARIDPALGPQLRSLHCELVWATTWGQDANECVAPRLGLPELPLVDWPEPSGHNGRGGVHWKTPALVAYAAGRPFVWVDDEIGAADRAWVSAHHPGRALLRRVDAGVGLAGADLAAIRAWLGPEAAEGPVPGPGTPSGSIGA